MNVKLLKKEMTLGVALLVLIISGCAKLSIEASGTPQAKCYHETVWESYYGFNWSSYEAKKGLNGIGLYQVTVHSNYWQSLISVISLGTVVPIEYEYQLQQPSVGSSSSNTDEMKPTTHLKR